MDLKATLSLKIKEFRKVRGFTQHDLAEVMNCSHSTIRDYENLVSFPGPEMLASLALALNVKPSDLINEESKAKEDFSLTLIRQIASLGPTELEILSGTLKALAKPTDKKLSQKKA